MSKNLIYIILIICGVLIAYIMVGGVFRNDLKKSVKNPYDYDLRDIRKIDPELIKYKETKRIGLTFPDPKALDYQDGQLCIGYANQLQLIDTVGVEVFNTSVEGPVTAIKLATNDEIFVACKTHILKYNLSGTQMESWSAIDSGSFITSIELKDDYVYVADAGGPVVYQYNLFGEILHPIDGKNRTDNKHGFIIPSPYFDLATDSKNQLWVANTGMQALENLSTDGAVRSFWGAASYDISGFIGCCNPAHFTILPNDAFVTCEKGLVRIKVYHASGALDAVVATPDDFDVNSEPLDLTADEQGNIYALDQSRKMIRKFERKES